MIDIQTIKDEFAKYNFSISYEELDSVFYITDAINTDGFISSNLPRYISRRIVDTYGSWANFFHRLLMPNPSNMLDLEESKSLDEQKKELLKNILYRIMELSSRNTKIGLKLSLLSIQTLTTNSDKNDIEVSLKDEVHMMQLTFFNDALLLWKDVMTKDLISVIEDINVNWKTKLAHTKDKVIKQNYGGII